MYKRPVWPDFMKRKEERNKRFCLLPDYIYWLTSKFSLLFYKDIKAPHHFFNLVLK